MQFSKDLAISYPQKYKVLKNSLLKYSVKDIRLTSIFSAQGVSLDYIQPSFSKMNSLLFLIFLLIQLLKVTQAKWGPLGL